MIHKLSILFYISFIFLNLAKAELNEVTKPTSWSWEGRYEISSNGEKEGNEEALTELYAQWEILAEEM